MKDTLTGLCQQVLQSSLFCVLRSTSGFISTLHNAVHTHHLVYTYPYSDRNHNPPTCCTSGFHYEFRPGALSQTYLCCYILWLFTCYYKHSTPSIPLTPARIVPTPSPGRLADTNTAAPILPADSYFRTFDTANKFLMDAVYAYT